MNAPGAVLKGCPNWLKPCPALEQTAVWAGQVLMCKDWQVKIKATLHDVFSLALVLIYYYS